MKTFVPETSRENLSVAEVKGSGRTWLTPTRENTARRRQKRTPLSAAELTGRQGDAGTGRRFPSAESGS